MLAGDPAGDQSPAGSPDLKNKFNTMIIVFEKFLPVGDSFALFVLGLVSFK